MAIFGGWRITRTGIVFVLGIVVLAAAVFGGVWMVKERGEQARQEEAVRIAQQNLEEQSQTPVNESDDEEEQGMGVVAVEDDDEATSAGSDVAVQGDQDEMPQTGAGLNMLLAIAFLTLAGAYYATSRRAVRQV